MSEIYQLNMHLVSLHFSENSSHLTQPTFSLGNQHEASLSNKSIYNKIQ
jgi:hypothetical protein